MSTFKSLVKTIEKYLGYNQFNAEKYAALLIEMAKKEYNKATDEMTLSKYN